MTIEGLAFMNKSMNSLGIPYEFMEWTSEVPETYFVGQYTEQPLLDEDGLVESDFILTGTTKKKFLELETVKERIREHFTSEGLTEILPSGAGIAVMYETAFSVPSIEENVHRIQINLKVKEWRC